MFDHLNINPVIREYVTKNVHEHRAPTDESVRLLREMETAARKQVLGSFPLAGNSLQGVAHRMEDVNTAQEVYVIQYVTNGIRRQLSVRIKSSRRDRAAYCEGVINELREALAQDIANEILSLSFIGFKEFDSINNP